MGVKVCGISGFGGPSVWAICGWWCKPSKVGRICLPRAVKVARFGAAAVCELGAGADAIVAAPFGLSPAVFVQMRALAAAAEDVVDRSDADDAVRTAFRFMRLWPFRWPANVEPPVTEDATAMRDPMPIGNVIDFFF